MYLNKAMVIGNITRDPEMRALPNGMKVTSMSVATNRVWKDKNGAKQESCDYHNVVVFGKQAESCAQYLRKGQSVLVEGRMQTRSWDDKDGNKKYRSEIVADRVQFGPHSQSNANKTDAEPVDVIDATTGEKASPKPKSSSTGATKVVAHTGIEYPEEEIDPNDIPF